MPKFKLQSKYHPTGDQPQAIAELCDGLDKGLREQALLGVTGSGKTFTMANIIQHYQKPTLILAHNKTLAAQLYSEFREFFPENEVHYFVSYFDYYQPEAYIASSDTYIEKDSAINDEIDRLRHAATVSLLTRPDTIIIASVSCIYGIGSPDHYTEMSLALRKIGGKWAAFDNWYGNIKAQRAGISGGISGNKNRYSAVSETVPREAYEPSEVTAAHDDGPAGTGSKKQAESIPTLAIRHKTIKKVTEDIHRHSFNTAVASLMEYVNELYKIGATTEDLIVLAKLLKPFAPHLASEMLEKLNSDDTWPTWDEKYLKKDTIELIVQVNGKLRAKLSVPVEALEDQAKLEELVKSEPNVQKFTKNGIKKIIFVKKAKLLNIVAAK